jgi:hypothetical protein
MSHEYPTQLADKVPPPEAGTLREKRKIKDVLTDIIYDERLHRRLGPFNVEPTALGIMRAVAAGEVDLREYDAALRATLGSECVALSKADLKTGANLGLLLDEIRNYHTRRVAYFVLNKWENQIIGLNEHGQLRDGGHRFRAAIFMGWEEVWVDFPAPPVAAPETSAPAPAIPVQI